MGYRYSKLDRTEAKTLIEAARNEIEGANGLQLAIGPLASDLAHLVDLGYAATSGADRAPMLTVSDRGWRWIRETVERSGHERDYAWLGWGEILTALGDRQGRR
ncbi:hypothetical protein [Glycomyces salinus]|uniref:hypothetical protein n=1 Tax=Glycomyces salinus TaxID=980294 RepID=UPI0018EB295F|nr:hypothetical protein [Glycomyces salinus]